MIESIRTESNRVTDDSIPIISELTSAGIDRFGFSELRRYGRWRHARNGPRIQTSKLKEFKSNAACIKKLKLKTAAQFFLKGFVVILL